MWYLRRPSDESVQHFLLRQEAQGPLSYPAVGSTADGEARTPPPGHVLDHNRVCLGQGQSIFESACSALRGWQQFPLPWTRVFPENAPLAPGQNVAVLARAFGAWWLNAARIVYIIDETTTTSPTMRRFGFAYGTLAEHVESGEERFSIEWQSNDDSVWYDLLAFSRPRYWLTRLAYPLARRMQRRFARESLATMKQLVSPAAAPGVTTPG
jgi:uncharacterized protein (UPF0548 family)